MVTRFHSTLVVLHVIDIPLIYDAPPDVAGWDVLTDAKEFCQIRKSAIEAFIAKEFRDVKAVPAFAESDAAKGIVRCAHENRVGLIMMPTHGNDTFLRFLVGSVAARVLHSADCPVWTAAHIGESTSYVSRPPHRILCAVETGSDASSVIRWATAFGKELGAKVQLVHAVPSSRHRPAEGGEKDCKRLFQLVHEEIQRTEAETSVRLEVTIREGEPEDVIRNIAEESQADLVIIGRSKIQKPFGCLRSRTYAITQETPCPVISV